MEWTDNAIILGLRRHGETSAILETMTRGHGRHLGLVRASRSKAMQPLLQPGNQVRLTWRARIDEHLGTFAVEGVSLHAARFFASRPALFALAYIAALVHFLPERDPHPGLYDSLETLTSRLDDMRAMPAALARFELAMLAELGFGLDLQRCAATGSPEDLIYVSPRSGRAVSREAGAPYRARLLPLPAFLKNPDGAIARGAIGEAFRLTGAFLERDVFAPRGLAMPNARAALLALLQGG